MATNATQHGRRLVLDPTTQRSFSDIYTRKTWGGGGKGSGAGSTVSFTIPLREKLIDLVSELSIASMIDVPCGAMEWQSKLFTELSAKKLPLRYHGADIVPSVIRQNEAHLKQLKERGSIPGVSTSFSVLDFADPDATLPGGFDLIFSRGTGCTRR